MYTLVTRSKDILDTSFTINDTGVNATNGVDTKFDTLASLQFSVTNAIYSDIIYLKRLFSVKEEMPLSMMMVHDLKS